MSFYHDEEVPAGFQDADIEMAELTELGHRIGDLNRQGICTHNGWVSRPANGQIYYPVQAELKPGQVACSEECGRIFDSEEELLNERAALLS